jgi:5'-AMP-activated protein kinase catalytic alpha subunit
MKKHNWWRKYSDNYYPEGLIVGYHKIPIDLDILRELKTLNYDIDFTEKSLEANRHNNLTTTYYLIMKKFIRKGGVSKAYFSGKQFDKLAIEPNERRQKSKKYFII